MDETSLFEFQRYVDLAGGPKPAAARLECSVSLINLILQGRRRVSRDLALACEVDSAGAIRKDVLLWGDNA